MARLSRAGIIRGRWEICCYEINAGLDPSMFAGAEIVEAPLAVRQRFEWNGRIMDSLPPEIRAARPADVAEIQAEARRLVRADALARSRQMSLSTRRISDVVRVNRVEGLAVGAGLARRLGGGFGLEAYGRWGFSDEEAKGRVALRYERAGGLAVRLFALRDHHDAGDVQEVSLIRNSFAAQEFGSDWTDPYEVTGVGIELGLGAPGRLRWRLELAAEEQEALAVNASPVRGSYAPTIPAWPLRVRRAVLGLDRPRVLGPLGTEIRAEVELRGAAFEGMAGAPPLGEENPLLGRAFARLEVERPFGARLVLLRSTAAAVSATSDGIPPQELVLLGGPISGPGYEYHQFAGSAGVTQRVELRTPVPFVPITLGRFGRIPGTATLAPYAHVLYVHRGSGVPAGPDGFRPALGVGLLTLFDVVRFDVAHGLRGGRWTFSVDVGRDFWSIL